MTANVSISEVNIAFTHTVKAMEPIFTAAFMMACGDSVTIPSPRGWASLVAVVAGVTVASTTEVSFTVLGFYAAMASNVTVSLRTVLSKRLLDSNVIDLFNVIAILHCGSFLVSFPIALLLEGKELPAILSSPSTCAMMPFTGLLVWVFNIASMHMLSKTSAVTHSLIRTLRRPMLVMASIVAFGSAVEPLNIVGIVMALGGAWLYNKAKHVTVAAPQSSMTPQSSFHHDQDRGVCGDT
eukprot:CAMPEP_0117616792 /NCGR_PEP_ID=MMETSP0784-20121206/85245_1 /TAXON_ID=39447 /ORGANISM="" /LENGTH=238 /DNA_ID=CAMNT_0005420585 /DNA_START=527 /DNA_END=1239 /DNA_ORIENTATION=+